MKANEEIQALQEQIKGLIDKAKAEKLTELNDAKQAKILANQKLVKELEQVNKILKLIYGYNKLSKVQRLTRDILNEIKTETILYEG